MKTLISVILILLVTSSLATHLKKAKHHHHHEKKVLHAFGKSHIKQTPNDYQEALDEVDQQESDIRDQIAALREDLNNDETLQRNVEDAFAQMDTDRDRLVEWDDFQAAIDEEAEGTLPSADDIRALFDQYDTDHSGHLDLNEVRALIVDIYQQEISSLESELTDLDRQRNKIEAAYEDYVVDHPAPIGVSEVARQQEIEDQASSQSVSEAAGQDENGGDAPQEHISSVEMSQSANDGSQEHASSGEASQDADDALFLEKNQNKHKLKAKKHATSKSH